MKSSAHGRSGKHHHHPKRRRRRGEESTTTQEEEATQKEEKGVSSTTQKGEHLSKGRGEVQQHSTGGVTSVLQSSNARSGNP